MSITVSTVHITVGDPEAALEFYRDGLGLAVVQDVANEGFRWVTLASEAQPGVSIVLSQPEPGRSPEDAAALAKLVASGAFTPVHLRTDDLDGLVARLRSIASIEIVQEATEQFWGVRDAAVRDPAGNLIRIEQA